ncbi:MAG TPA: DUF2105 family protein [Methanothermobacter sp.]|jgi:energy-converting hydrogenase A subunit G|uniref:Membrane protein n=1 Tax=Methanothermobacter tenebrarum TaxID=680118 RepID=A0ABN6PCZ1_9EURY|nr:DUF2105 family protein [Methanothermobacter tenebrarum]MDD3453934.1 DUF2105 family protein [Methanobacteriales archaeon]MDX9692757.1 DUF2105 family protein [Methanothermobacter sp.]BDH80100.1 membrane protein [Methanothermobacter tenebrarum]HHW15941.1 DUF2105 family protein [Methanothermobacter sp.]
MDPSSIVPNLVPQIIINFYPIAIIIAILTATIGLSGVIIERDDFQKILIIQIVTYAMLIIVAAVGTDLAEALILPGLVVSLAEILAVTEVLIFREYTKRGTSYPKLKKYKPIEMEIIKTAIPITSLLCVIYGTILTGFTGGAVAGAGILIYLFIGEPKGLSHDFWEEMSGVSGLAWCLWLLGFLLYFLNPRLWLVALFMSGGGIIIKVALKFGLLGILNREEFNK